MTALYPYRFVQLRRPDVSLPWPCLGLPREIGTSMLLLPPRWVQPGDKSDLGKTPVCCLRCDGLGIIVPSLRRSFPLPNPSAATPAIRFPRKSAGCQYHAKACSSLNGARDRTDSCSAPNRP